MSQLSSAVRNLKIFPFKKIYYVSGKKLFYYTFMAARYAPKPKGDFTQFCFICWLHGTCC